MRKLLCILLILVILTGLLTGCGKEAEKLVGTWEADLDMTPVICEELGSEFNDLFTLNDLIFTTRITFCEDGTYQITVDSDSVAAAFDNILSDMEAGLIEMMEKEIAVLGLDISVEDMLALSGRGTDILIDETISAIDLDSIIDQAIEECSVRGNFEVKGGKLYLSDGLDQSPNSYKTYTINGTTLTLSASGAEDGAFSGLYPVTFTKLP